MVTACLEDGVTDRLVWTPEGKAPAQCAEERETRGCVQSPGDKGDPQVPLRLAEASQGLRGAKAPGTPGQGAEGLPSPPQLSHPRRGHAQTDLTQLLPPRPPAPYLPRTLPEARFRRPPQPEL